MSSSVELSITKSQGYDEKAEVEVKLLQQMSSEDYKAVTDAATLIVDTAAKYFIQREEKTTDVSQ